MCRGQRASNVNLHHSNYLKVVLIADAFSQKPKNIRILQIANRPKVYVIIRLEATAAGRFPAHCALNVSCMKRAIRWASRFQMPNEYQFGSRRAVGKEDQIYINIYKKNRATHRRKCNQIFFLNCDTPIQASCTINACRVAGLSSSTDSSPCLLPTNGHTSVLAFRPSGPLQIRLRPVLIASEYILVVMNATGRVPGRKEGRRPTAPRVRAQRPLLVATPAAQRSRKITQPIVEPVASLPRKP